MHEFPGTFKRLSLIIKAGRNLTGCLSFFRTTEALFFGNNQIQGSLPDFFDDLTNLGKMCATKIQLLVFFLPAC